MDGHAHAHKSVFESCLLNFAQRKILFTLMVESDRVWLEASLFGCQCRKRANKGHLQKIYEQKTQTRRPNELRANEMESLQWMWLWRRNEWQKKAFVAIIQQIEKCYHDDKVIEKRRSTSLNALEWLHFIDVVFNDRSWKNWKWCVPHLRQSQFCFATLCTPCISVICFLPRVWVFVMPATRTASCWPVFCIFLRKSITKLTHLNGCKQLFNEIGKSPHSLEQKHFFAIVCKLLRCCFWRCHFEMGPVNTNACSFTQTPNGKISLHHFITMIWNAHQHRTTEKMMME